MFNKKIMNLRGPVFYLLLLLTFSIEIIHASEQNNKEVHVTATLSRGRTFISYYDPQFINDRTYLSSAWHLYKVITEVKNYYSHDLTFFLGHLDSPGKRLATGNQNLTIERRQTEFLHASATLKTEMLNIAYGITGMLTFENTEPRLHLSKGVLKDSSTVLNSYKTSAGPSLGLYFFPEFDVGFQAEFLTPQVNFMYGWLGTSVWLQVSNSIKLAAGMEIWNESNFTEDQSRLFNASTSAFTKISYEGSTQLISFKTGLLIHPNEIPLADFIKGTDRMYLEAGYGIKI